MSEAINSVLFGWYPYLCLTVFLLGSLLRFEREQYTWKTGSSQLLRKRQLRWGSHLRSAIARSQMCRARGAPGSLPRSRGD